MLLASPRIQTYKYETHQVEIAMYIDVATLFSEEPCTVQASWVFHNTAGVTFKTSPIQMTHSTVSFSQDIHAIITVRYNILAKKYLREDTDLYFVATPKAEPKKSKILGKLPIDVGRVLNTDSYGNLTSYPLIFTQSDGNVRLKISKCGQRDARALKSYKSQSILTITPRDTPEDKPKISEPSLEIIQKEGTSTSPFSIHSVEPTSIKTQRQLPTNFLIKSLQAKIMKLQTINMTLCDQINALHLQNVQVQDLCKKLEAQKKLRSEYDHSFVKQLEEEVGRLQEDNNQLFKRISELQAEMAQFNSNRQIYQLSFDSEILEYKHFLEERQEQVQKLNHQNGVLEERYSKVRKQLDNQNHEVQFLKERLAFYEKDNVETCSSQQRIPQTNHSHYKEQENHLTRSKAHNQAKLIEEFSEANNQLVEALQQKDKEIRWLYSNIASLQKTVEDYESREKQINQRDKDCQSSSGRNGRLNVDRSICMEDQFLDSKSARSQSSLKSQFHQQAAARKFSNDSGLQLPFDMDGAGQKGLESDSLDLPLHFTVQKQYRLAEIMSKCHGLEQRLSNAEGILRSLMTAHYLQKGSGNSQQAVSRLLEASTIHRLWGTLIR